MAPDMFQMQQIIHNSHWKIWYKKVQAVHFKELAGILKLQLQWKKIGLAEKILASILEFFF
jgi:hypothetical protein